MFPQDYFPGAYFPPSYWQKPGAVAPSGKGFKGAGRKRYLFAEVRNARLEAERRREAEAAIDRLTLSVLQKRLEFEKAVRLSRETAGAQMLSVLMAEI